MVSEKRNVRRARAGAPHSQRARLTECVKQRTQPRGRRAVLPAEERELGLHVEGGLRGVRRRRGRAIADDVGVVLREVVRERDNPPLARGCIGGPTTVSSRSMQR